jgi:hypothetical protein
LSAKVVAVGDDDEEDGEERGLNASRLFAKGKCTLEHREDVAKELDKTRFLSRVVVEREEEEREVETKVIMDWCLVSRVLWSRSRKRRLSFFFLFEVSSGEICFVHIQKRKKTFFFQTSTTTTTRAARYLSKRFFAFPFYPTCKSFFFFLLFPTL